MTIDASGGRIEAEKSTSATLVVDDTPAIFRSTTAAPACRSMLNEKDGFRLMPAAVDDEWSTPLRRMADGAHAPLPTVIDNGRWYSVGEPHVQHWRATVTWPPARSGVQARITVPLS